MSGNGRLAWRDIRPILARTLDDRFTVVTFGKATRTPKGIIRKERR